MAEPGATCGINPGTAVCACAISGSIAKKSNVLSIIFFIYACDLNCRFKNCTNINIIGLNSVLLQKLNVDLKH